MDGCIGVFEVVKFHTKRHRALLPSLREYLLLRQDSLQADLYQRAADGRWQHQRLTAPGDVLTLECLGAHVTLSEIYVDPADLSVA